MVKKALLDTSFILSCIRHKIDFFNDLESEGIKVLIPAEIIEEIKRIPNSRKKKRHKRAAIIALRYILNNNFEKIALNSEKKPGFIVDKGIIEYAEKNPEVIVATLDREIKTTVPTQKLIITRKKRLEIIN
jgi:rRNA-processing protein FCF1